jgi:acetylglutamate kinase
MRWWRLKWWQRSDVTKQLKNKAMMKKLTVVKVGGKIVENESTLQQLLKDFSAIDGAKVLVHGGGRSATKVAAQLGIESTMIGGRRVTDADMLRVVTMVYGGLVNKNIVARLQACGINALGLTGADMNVMLSHKRPLKKVKMDDGTEQMVDFGFVGDVDQCDGRMLATLIGEGVVPVMAPLTHDKQGHLLNTNADTIAGETAKALAPYFDVTLIYSFEHAGVLTDPDDETSVIPHIDAEEFEQLKADGTVNGGMIPKIENALEAVRAGVKQVIITKADAIDGTKGTVIS